jgi:peptidylprolyl isomerase
MKKIVLLIILISGNFGALPAQTIVTFYTTLGSFEVELYDTLKPITAGNFKSLVNTKYYDGVIFHRVISNFMIQGGDPTGTGSGGPGYTIDDEFDSTLSNVVRTISMANSGPNTGGSQFFINVKNNTYLDFDKAPLTSAHPVFGIVISGWDTVELIEAVPVNASNRPNTPVVMDSIRVTQFPLGIQPFFTDNSTSVVYPNPVNEQSILEFKSTIASRGAIRVYSQNGMLISSQNVSVVSGVNNIPLSKFGVQNLSSGMYFMTINNGADLVRKKFIVMR